jgi:tetratricopeptide (TPR) repeat protein
MGIALTNIEVNQFAEAEEVLRRAVARLESGSKTRRFRTSLAEAFHNLGFVLVRSHRYKEAAEISMRAQEIEAELLTEHPNDIKLRRLQINTLELLSECNYRLGHWVSAESSLNRAINSIEALIADGTGISADRMLLAHTKSNLGEVLSKLGRTREAGQVYREASVIAKAVLDHQPDDQRSRQLLHNSLHALQRIAREMGNDSEVVEAQRELDHLNATDPAKIALDARLAVVLAGEGPKVNTERLRLAYHAYERKHYYASARLFADALETESALADDRARQHPYNAACAAALALANSPSPTLPADGEGAKVDGEGANSIPPSAGGQRALVSTQFGSHGK